MIENAEKKLAEMVDIRRAEAANVTAEAEAKAEDIVNRANKYSEDIRSATSEFLDRVMQDADIALVDSLAEIRRARQSIHPTETAE